MYYETKKTRKSLKDIWWNAFMTEDAKFDTFDIPFCPTVLTDYPTEILTWDEAKARLKSEIKQGNDNPTIDAFVCFYSDDWKFDTSSGIWFRPWKAYETLKHFKGIITPDFSTYLDFPYPLKLWNTYRMRAFGYWISTLGIEVINNIRGDITTLDMCALGLPRHSVYAIGTVGSGLRHIENRPQFEQWIYSIADKLEPKAIIVYGSANYKCFDILQSKGIKIIAFPSKTDLDFKRRRNQK